jgi:hypothetical protein
MTGEAELRGSAFKQSVIVRGMGIVAAQAFALAHGLMHYPLAAFTVFLAMAGLAQVAHLLLEHPLVSRHMRAVAGAAFPFRHRLMLHFFLEGGAVVA